MFVKDGDSSCSARQRRKSVSERLGVSSLSHWGGSEYSVAYRETD